MDQRKLVVLLVIVLIFAISSIWTVAHWLADMGLIEVASYLRAEFLTGTAIAVIAVMLYLLPSRRPLVTHHDQWPFD